MEKSLNSVRNIWLQYEAPIMGRPTCALIIFILAEKKLPNARVKMRIEKTTCD